MSHKRIISLWYKKYRDFSTYSKIHFWEKIATERMTVIHRGNGNGWLVPFHTAFYCNFPRNMLLYSLKVCVPCGSREWFFKHVPGRRHCWRNVTIQKTLDSYTEILERRWSYGWIRPVQEHSCNIHRTISGSEGFTLTWLTKKSGLKN